MEGRNALRPYLWGVGVRVWLVGQCGDWLVLWGLVAWLWISGGGDGLGEIWVLWLVWCREG